MNRKISFVIIDVIKTIRSSKIKKKTPREGERFWVLKCLENTVRVFQTELSDQKFIDMLEDRTAIGKKVRFGCQSFWNHVIEVEVLENE